MSEIKIGQVVRVRNQRLNGDTFIEGYPKVVKIREDMHNGYIACDVLFPDDDTPVFRWIDAEDQLNVIQ